MLTVVFDLGQVLASMSDQLTNASARLGVAEDVLEPAYWRHRKSYDLGSGNHHYWTAVTADLGLRISEADADELGASDARSWVRIRPAAEAILRELREAGVATHVLSNAPADMTRALEEAAWRPLVDRLFVSADLGVIKPDPEIYRVVQESLGLSPDQIAFIDDKQPNVDGALAAGWRAELWRDDRATRAWLQRLALLG